MSGASRDVGMMAEGSGKEELETGHQTSVENERSDAPQTLPSPLDAPSTVDVSITAIDPPTEVQSLNIGSESSDKGWYHGAGNDAQHWFSKEDSDATNAQCNSSEASLEDNLSGAAHEREQASSLPEMSTLERGAPETSGVERIMTNVDEAGRIDRSECLVSAVLDMDGETGGPMCRQATEEPACNVSAEDGDIEQICEKIPEYSSMEAKLEESMEAKLEESMEAKLEESMEAKLEESMEAKLEESMEAKLEESMDAIPGPTAVAEDDHKEATDSASDHTLEDSGDFPGMSSVVGGVVPDASPPVTPVQREEDVTAESWRTKRKHVFVLSEAGKPIYSRYGNEEALSSTMGVMMALVSFVQSGNNSIRSIHSDKQKVVFLQQGPLVLVSVSRAPQSEEQLRKELQYVYYQIISMLTQASVARIFERKKNYDLRRLLAGSEKILDSLLDLLDTDPGFLLGAVRCVALPSPLRDSLSSILTKAITPNLVFSILVAEQQLVTVVQERAVIEDCRLDPADLHLLLNLIGASSAFQAGEIWTPICLPRFNPDGYFYAYISYLDPECTVCLVLLSTDKESFYAVSGCKKRIQEAMEAQNSLQALAGALRCCSYSVSMVGAPELLHFVYKPLDIPDTYRQLPQFTSPEPDGPYTSEEERQRLFDLYRYLHCRIHSSARPLRLIYHVAEKETLLAWVTSKFELYTAFSSLVTKVGAINVITKLLRWIKREEDRLFIRYPPKYSTTPVPGKGVKSSRTDRTDPSHNGFFTGL